MTAESPQTPPEAIATPCVLVCEIDGVSGLCLGCLRTLSEIAQWSRFTDAQRAEVLAALPARRGRVGPDTLGPA